MALTFGAATSDRVNVSNSTSIQNLDPFTILLWVYPTTFTASRVLWSKNTQKRIAYDASTGTIDVIVTYNTALDEIVTSTTLTLNAWNCVGVSFDSADQPRVFIGSLTSELVEAAYAVQDLSGSGGVAADSGGDLIIGNRSTNANAFQGRIAVHEYCNVKLTLGEMIDWQFHPRNSRGSVLYSHCGFNGTGTQADWSGNANSGTVTGATVGDHVPLTPLFGKNISFGPWVIVPNVVPKNVTFLWTGTNASIPSGWVRDTNLDAKYAKGTAAGVDPGGTGGALTHSHTTANHNHTTAHVHTTGNDASETGSSNRDVNTTNPPAAHTHVSNPNTVNPTTTLANDTPATDAVNNEPSYFEVIYIKSDGTPLGIADSAVALWNDKNSTPSGWNLCDGGGAPARPDMRNRWLKGAAAGGNGGATGGGLTHTHSIVSHTHTTPYAHTHPNVTSSTTATALGSGDISGAAVSVATSGHTHVFSIDSASPVITGNTDSAASSDHQPPYVVQAFIQNNKGAADLPKGIIGMWGQTLANIPIGWHLCDGTDGTPDLRSNYVKGANTLSDIGTTGGSLTHGASHTATGHTHAVASHTHTQTHVSTTGAENRTAGAVATATGTHTHTWNSTGAQSFTSGTGTPSVNNYTDTQPPFYTVAFIQYKPVRWGIREILQALNRGAVI